MTPSILNASKEVINQCVKCGARFTSIDKPLKLLPCLHSMCIDCLEGKLPPPPRRSSSHRSSVDTSDNISEKNVADRPTENADKSVSEVTSSEENKSDDGTKPDSSEQNDKQDEDNKPKEQDKCVATPIKECPLCRDPIDVAGPDLMENMFASLDSENVNSPEGEKIHTCTGCDDGLQACSYCMQCEEWLCESCVDAHKKVKMTKSHVISPKDEVKISTSKSLWEQHMTCKQHRNEQLKFFCEKCEKLTCRDCQLMDHKDHKYQFLDQAADHYKARLKGSLALMGEKRSKLSANRDEIDQKLKDCRDQKNSLQQDILHQAEVLVKGIRQAVFGVLSNLASFTDAASKRLNKEIEDVSDLIAKFDHCISFMDEILNDGSSMSLLYSKQNVEAKCRKVYHTQMDPNSLKGNLLIQYRHEVNWLLGNLSKVGSIFVNGARYPPEKSNVPGSRHAVPNNSAYQDHRGMNATSPHLQHMANQPVPGQRGASDWTMFKQNGPKQNPVVPPPNISMSTTMAGALPSQLTLPSSRRPTGQMFAGNIPMGPFVANPPLLSHHQQGPPPQRFTPMRLNHRPSANAFPNFSNQNDHSSQSMRSPPQYPRGSEASGSSSRTSHSTPDPARPASAGMYDARPDSGGSAMMEVKKEKREDCSPDCVITASNMKGHAHTSQNQKLPESVMEMQKNLDEVLRGVPMDFSDSMEQISSKQPTSEITTQVTTPSAVKPTSISLSPPPPLVSNGRANSADRKSPTDEELRENWQGGNSMPGFSLSQVDTNSDPNDDYCAVCHNGGDVLCCDDCPKVYHLKCHIPPLDAVPSGAFKCTMCGDASKEDVNENGKRKSTDGLSNIDIKMCEKILLDLFCNPQSLPFHEPVDKAQVPNYYKIIYQAVDFRQIKNKLQRSHQNHYTNLKAFLFDLRQVFINCAIYNKAGSEVGKAGKIVREAFENLVEKLMPQYLSFVKEDPSPGFIAVTDLNDPEMQSSATLHNANACDSPPSPKRQRMEETATQLATQN